MFAPRSCRLFRFLLALALGGLVGAAVPAVADEQPTTSNPLLPRIGVERGLCVVTGSDAEQTGLDLAGASELTLFVVLPERSAVDRLRRRADQGGWLAHRLYVEAAADGRIGLASNLVDAVVIAGQTGIPKAELLRVLHPGGRIVRAGREPSIEAKPNPPGLGSWSHPYHGPDNNPLADDTIARAPYLTQFLGTPWYVPMPEVTVSAGGRVFKAFGHIAMKRRAWPMLNRLIALNGYNGTMLWERDLKPGFMIHRNTMIATPEVLYLADDESCKVLDAATGRLRREIVVPVGLSDGPVWKWMALEDGVLYALVGERELIDEVIRGTRTQPGWPWRGLGDAYAREDYPWGFGRTLLAIDPQTGRVIWHRREEKRLDARGLCMRNGRIYAYSGGNWLEAVDARTGQLIWRTSDPALLEAIGPHLHAQNPRQGFSSTSYIKCSDECIYFAGPQRQRLVAVSTKDGRLLWQYPVGNFQLVIRDDALYAMGRDDESKKFAPLTGEVLAELACFRGNCTRATGTVDAVFARGASHGGTLRLSLYGDQPRRLPAMRPACQDGVIAANGLLYWGPWMCDCNHSLVGVISLAPAGEFDFAKHADDKERLETADSSTTATDAVRELEITDRDWPTYRANNLRTAATPVAIPDNVQIAWTYTPPAANRPTAPIAVGEYVFVAGEDGAVRAIDAATGNVRWVAYTGGAVRYPPSVWEGRLYVGSGDGWVYAFEAVSGRPLWRFRAAPEDRRIPVYGNLISTWPVNSGVLVEDGVAYAAAGIVSHDGTHVYALDARTGRLKWHNKDSGRLMGEDVLAGVSVQGHLLLHDGKLYMAGGNVVSPAVYDAANGTCLNRLTDEWQKAPRGSELFLVNDQVVVAGRMLYSPREYIPSRYYAKYLLQASAGDVIVQGTEQTMMRIAAGSNTAKPKVLWQRPLFAETAAVVLGRNAVLAAGRTPVGEADADGNTESQTDASSTVSLVAALDPEDGRPLWVMKLPAAVEDWGLAVNRDGRVLVALLDGRVVCLQRR